MTQLADCDAIVRRYESMSRTASMIRFVLAVLFVIALCLFVAGQAFGGHNACAVQLQHHAVYAQPVVALNQVYPPAYYSVGAAIQEDAIAERVAAKVLERLSGAKMPAEPGAPEPIPGEHAQLNQSAVGQSCVKCHSGEKPKAGIDFTVVASLDCETRLAAMTAVLEQRMPPGKPLDATAVGDVLHEFATAKLTGDEGIAPERVTTGNESAPPSPAWTSSPPTPPNLGEPGLMYDSNTKQWSVNVGGKWEPYDKAKHPDVFIPDAPPNPPPFKN